MFLEIIIQNTMTISDIISAIFTFILVVVTSIYVIETYKMRVLMNKELIISKRPYISITDVFVKLDLLNYTLTNNSNVIVFLSKIEVDQKIKNKSIGQFSIPIGMTIAPNEKSKRYIGLDKKENSELKVITIKVSYYSVYDFSLIYNTTSQVLYFQKENKTQFLNQIANVEKADNSTLKTKQE